MSWSRVSAHPSPQADSNSKNKNNPSAGLGTGKLPPTLLRDLVLTQRGARRPETLIGAALGIDAAAIALAPDAACVLTTDPITTATTGSGRLAVHVVCNDLATMGAEPIGVLATLLFPAGVTEQQVRELAAEIATTCSSLNVEVLGGHTEIAPGLVAPLIVMAGVGTAPRDRLLTAGGGRAGDRLVLSKAAALEGTHILANDFADALGDLPETLLADARACADELSVVPDARVAAQAGATALHDPTEGGVIGAAWEMAEASGRGFEIAIDRIPVRASTRLICSRLGVDPLRLIASGALLIATPDAARTIADLHAAGIAATDIGELTDASPRRLIHADGSVEQVTTAPRDEIYRLHAERGVRPPIRSDADV